MPICYTVFNNAYDSRKLSISQRRGIITLIPKPNKDTTVLDNLRPKSLLNTDHKILTKVIAKRLEKVLPKIINPDQTGYIKNRYIGENVSFNFRHHDVHRREQHARNRSLYRL